MMIILDDGLWLPVVAQRFFAFIEKKKGFTDMIIITTVLPKLESAICPKTIYIRVIGNKRFNMNIEKYAIV